MEDHPILAGLAIFMAVIILFLGLGWLFMGNDFFMYKWLAPRQAEVQRETFEQSRSFNEGMIQNLRNEWTQYLGTSDPASRDALASIILHEVADYDTTKLPSDLSQFVNGLKKDYPQYSNVQPSAFAH